MARARKTPFGRPVVPEVYIMVVPWTGLSGSASLSAASAFS